MSKSVKFWMVAAVIFIGCNAFTLHSGHNWGGDFSQNILHAKNIVNGESYVSNVVLEEWWGASPPGYPFILAALIKAFDLNFYILKLPNLLFWLVYVYYLFHIAVLYVDKRKAHLIAFFLLFSPFFFVFKQNIITDVPFLALITAALYYFLKHDRDSCSDEKTQKGSSYLYYAFLFVFLALTVRWAAKTLILSYIIHSVFIRKKLKAAFVIIVLSAVVVFLQSLMGVSVSGPLNGIPPTFLEWGQIILKNVSYVLNTVVYFFLPVDTFLADGIFLALQPLFKWIGWLLIVLFVVYIGLQTLRRKVSLLELFIFISFLEVVVWPFHGGSRYILPVAGLFLVLFIRACEKVSFFQFKIKSFNVAEYLLMILICHNILSISMVFDFNDDMIFKKEVNELVQWMEENTSSQEHFMFFKPRVLGMLSDRIGTWYKHPVRAEKNWTERVRKYNIRYIVIVRHANDSLIKDVRENGFGVQKVWANASYDIYHIEEK